MSKKQKKIRKAAIRRYEEVVALITAAQAKKGKKP